MVLMTIAVSVRTYTKAIIVRDMRHEDCTYIYAHISWQLPTRFPLYVLVRSGCYL